MKAPSAISQIIFRLIGFAVLLIVAALILYGCRMLWLYNMYSNLSEAYRGPKTYTRQVEALSLEVWVNPGWISSGESVTIRFTITNTGIETFIREKLDAPVIDLVVPTDYSDRYPREGALPPPTMRWSETQPPDRIPHRLELKPGESRKIELTYAPKVRQGQEVVQGRIWAYTDYDSVIGFISVGATVY